MLRHSAATDPELEPRQRGDAGAVSVLHGELPQAHLRDDLLAEPIGVLEAS